MDMFNSPHQGFPRVKMDVKTLRERGSLAAVRMGEGLLRQDAGNDALRERLAEGPDVVDDGLQLQELYRSVIKSLHQMMVVFLLEDRELILAEKPEQQSGEAVQPQLNELATRRYRQADRAGIESSSTSLYAEFQTLMFGLNQGSEEGDPPWVGSALLSSGFTGLPTGVTLLNEDFLDVVDLLCREGASLESEPLDWSTVSMATLSGVHEGLLELNPTPSPDREGFSLAEGEGNDRKSSGSFYTPEPLVKLLVADLVDPLVARAHQDAEEQTGQSKGDAFRLQAQDNILALTVCDPACGTGHFLLAAMHRLASALVDLDEDPVDKEAAMRRWKGEVSRRCLFGVDLNPLAVELCKLALWLEAEDHAHPVCALDGHIKHGNGLLGQRMNRFDVLAPLEAFEGWEEAQAKHTSALRDVETVVTPLLWKAADIDRRLTQLNTPKEASIFSFERDTNETDAAAIQALTEERAQLEGIIDLHRSGFRIQQMDLVRNGDLRRVLQHHITSGDSNDGDNALPLQWVKSVLDASIAAWWWPEPEQPVADRFDPLSGLDLYRYATWLAHDMGIGHDVLRATVQGPEVFEPDQDRFERVKKQVEDIATAHSFFHWELEFPDVLVQPESSAQGHFSGVLANPPFINAWAMHGQANASRRFTKASEEALTKHWDLASAFLLLGRRLATSTAFVLPTGILTEKHGDPIRRLLVSSQTNVTDWTGRDWFKEAAVDVFVATHTERATGMMQRFLSEQGLSPEVPLTEVFETIGDQVLYVPEPVPFAAALREHSDPLGCHVHLNYGVQANPKEKGGSKDDNVYNSADACKVAKRYAEAKHILESSQVEVQVDVELWLDYEPDALYGPRTPAFFEAEKLVIKHVSPTLDVYVDRSGLYMNHSTVLCVPHGRLPEGEDEDFGYARLNIYSIDQLHLLLHNRFTVEHYLSHIKGSVNNYPKPIREILIPRVEPEALQTILALPFEERQAAVDDLVGSLIGQ